MVSKAIFLLTFAVFGPAAIHGQNSPKFAIDLYKTLAASNENIRKSVAISPFSIETALTMTLIGASGITKSELTSTLGISADATPEILAKKFKSVRSSSNGYTLKTANKLYLEKAFPIDQQYKNSLMEKFESDISSADFKNNHEAERATINAWVEGKTNNKIHNLLPAGSLDKGTKLVLVNAVYFKANWSMPFKPAFTVDGAFSTSNGYGQTKPAKMMHQEDSFKYSESAELGGAQLLELKYQGDETSMVVILPKQVTGLRGLAFKLTPATFESALGRLKSEAVRVKLPKFRVEAGFSLADTLKGMGIKQAFTDSAQFPGISKKAVKISRVEHKAYIQVDEDGTEAAAATAVVMPMVVSMRIPINPPKIFHADRPFIFLIRHNPSKTILFMGHVEEPSAK